MSMLPLQRHKFSNYFTIPLRVFSKSAKIRLLVIRKIVVNLQS